MALPPEGGKGFAHLDTDNKIHGEEQRYGTTANTAVEGNDSRLTAGVGFVIENRTSDPASPATGRIWLRTDL